MQVNLSPGYSGLFSDLREALIGAFHIHRRPVSLLVKSLSPNENPRPLRLKNLCPNPDLVKEWFALIATVEI
jgi:hypothetical protein